MATILLKPESVYSVGKIVCVGQNYVKHIEELSSKRQNAPVIFLKPSTAILTEGYAIELPEYSKDVHHETELALLIGSTARRIKAEEWFSFVAGVGIALDLTLRDLQTHAKERGLPWAVSKGFDGSCPVSEFVPLRQINDIQDLAIELRINNELRQRGSTRDMIYPVSELMAYISGIFTLEPGDLILTGTPAGVSPLRSGDHLEAAISEVGKMVFTVK